MSAATPAGGVRDPSSTARTTGQTPGEGRLYRVTLRTASEKVLAELGEAIEAWGGEWRPSAMGGELVLPVRAGLRYGQSSGRARVTALAGGCELVVEIHEERWAVNRAAVLLLAVAGITGLAGVLWPFFPALTPFAPLGLVLGASVWLAVLARLRHQGPAELLAELAAAVEEGLAGAEPPAPITPL